MRTYFYEEQDCLREGSISHKKGKYETVKSIYTYELCIIIILNEYHYYQSTCNMNQIIIWCVIMKYKHLSNKNKKKHQKYRNACTKSGSLRFSQFFLNATHFLARKRTLGIRYVKNDSCFRDHHYLTMNVVLWVIWGAGCVYKTYT
jgi:hypothetical protein